MTQKLAGITKESPETPAKFFKGKMLVNAPAELILRSIGYSMGSFYKQSGTLKKRMY